MNRKTARENTFILLFEKKIKKDETFEDIFAKATEIRALETDDYVKKVFFGCAENNQIIEETVEECLVGWKKERISFVSSAIITLATFELMFMEDIPSAVSLNEAIELVKRFDDGKMRAFVNGLLNGAKNEIEAAAE